MAKLKAKGRRQFGFKDGGDAPQARQGDFGLVTDPPPDPALVRKGLAPGDKPYPGSAPVYQTATEPYAANPSWNPKYDPVQPDLSGMYPSANPHYHEGELVFPVGPPAGAVVGPDPSLFYKWGWGRGSEPDVAQHEKLQQQQEDWAQWKMLQQQQAAGLPKWLQDRNPMVDRPQPPPPPPNPQSTTTFSGARAAAPASPDVEVRPRDPTLKSDLDYWREQKKKGKAKGGALRFQDGDLVDEDQTPDSWYGESGGISDVSEPQLQRPASETAERERLLKLQSAAPNPAPDTLQKLQYNALAPTPPNSGQNLLRFDPGAAPQNLLRFDPAAAAQNAPTVAPQIKPAAPALSLDERIRQQDIAAAQRLREQERDDIFSPSQKPLLDYLTEVGNGNVGAWHTQPGKSDLSVQSNDPNSYSIGFDPNSNDRIYSKGSSWFYTSGKPYAGNAVNLKTTIFPQGPAPPDEESTVQQSYGPGTTTPAPAAPAPTTPPAAAPATKTSFVPRGAGTIDASPILNMIDAAATKNGVPRNLLYGHVMAESGGNPNAVSPKGAQGIMQIMPGTAASLGVKNPFDPQQAIDAGARYLSQLYKRFRNWDQASMAYNAGPKNIARGIVPQETRNYLPRVKRFAAQAPPSQNAQQKTGIGAALSSLGGSQQQQPQPQPVDLPKAPLPPTEPMNQKDYSDRLKSIMDMIGLGSWAKGGEVHGDAAQDREQMLGILREKKLIKKKGGRAEFAKGGIADLPEPPKKIPGKDVLHRAPLGHALLPVLHTTIVIGVSPKKGKKKGEKKAEGGRLETSPDFPDTPPRKPRAIPPRRGKTPRGVGKALRGWGQTGR